jgi:hypothetical protein
MSEESIQMSSQHVTDNPDPPLEVGGSKGKPRFAEFACSHPEVIDICRVLFPVGTLKWS